MDYSVKEDIIEYDFTKFLQSNILLYCVVLLLVLKIAAIMLPINLPYNIFFADITKSTLENFANQTRQSLGLKPLIENQKLNLAAQLKAENMVQNQYFDHTSPSGVTPWFWFLKAGYNYKYAGENLAIGFFDSEEVYNAWLNSAPHKANIVNPNYSEVGTAVLNGFGQNNTIVVVQEFGTQLALKPAAALKPNPAVKTAEPVANNNTQSSVTAEKVLSQSTEQNYLESPTGTGADNLPSKLFNFILYNYDNLLQDIIYGVSLVVIGVLLAMIFFNINFSFKRELVFRAVLIVVLLSAAALLNKETIISLIPHQISI